MNTLNRDRNTLKRLVESYGKKDVLDFVNHLNESFKTVYTSYDIAAFADAMWDTAGEDNEDTRYTNAVYDIAGPWNSALENVGLPGGITNDEPDPDDIRKCGIFYMGIWSQPMYMGEYESLDYNEEEICIFPGIKVDKVGMIQPAVSYINEDGEEKLFNVNVKSESNYAKQLAILLNMVKRGSGPDVEELIYNTFDVISVEKI